MIDVEVDGEAYQEMHVDGGAMAQVFLYPSAFHLAEQSVRLHAQRPRQFYIIRNARLDPDSADVERRTFRIASRAIPSLIHPHAIGDLSRLIPTSRRARRDHTPPFNRPNFDLSPHHWSHPH